MVVAPDPNGRFTTPKGLEKGRYLIEALVPGYKIASTEVTIEKSQEIEIKLTPLPKTSQKTIGINMNLDESRGTGGATIMPPSL
jgi:hypothetical protein